ncbi:DUF1828 domain-containing protein [Alloalcanivorax xenomutans]|uniref:DUF1828 domain-containing protein n=1 Tax=Alloalcanivorax xenomutans TaxID=1094342 RepID=UPI003BA8AB7D
MISCDWLQQTIGYSCRKVRDSILAVDSPFSLVGGAPISFYLMEEGRLIKISDNGDTLAHFESIGLTLSAARKKKIHDTLGRHEIALSKEGEVFGLSNPEHARDLIARYQAALLEVAAYQDEISRSPDRSAHFIDEVEMALRSWKPDVPLERSPKVKGGSRHEYHFDFKWGSSYVDAIAPHPNATGAFMRKIGDIVAGSYIDRDTIFKVVIDDRHDLLKAELEKSIITSIASGIMYSDIERQINPPAPHH